MVTGSRRRSQPPQRLEGGWHFIAVREEHTVVFEGREHAKAALGSSRVSREGSWPAREASRHRTDDIARKQDSGLLEPEAAMAGCMARRLKDPQIPHQVALPQGTERPVVRDRLLVLGASPHRTPNGTGHYLRKAANVISVAVRQDDVRDVVPLRAQLPEHGLDYGVDSLQPRVDEDQPVSMSHEVAPHIEVDGCWTCNACWEAYRHDDRPYLIICHRGEG